MEHNKNSLYEKPYKECPHRCSECGFYEDETCIANGCRSFTFSFSKPTDRPLPMPLNCYWWYANRVWNTVSKEKIETYTEQRRHLMVFFEMLRYVPVLSDERKAFIKHFHRPGGCEIIDFNLYPQAMEVYKKVIAKEEDGGL